jgi:hypothetical protein
MTSHVLVETGFRATGTSTPKKARAASKPLPKVGEGVPGEHLIGVAFAASALAGGGWFFWAIARALETYRLY